MMFFTRPFSFVASHPLYDNAPCIIDLEGKLVATLLMPTVAPEDVEAATLELTKIGVAMAESIK